jgi:Ca-activated chloride channel homolog
MLLRKCLFLILLLGALAPNSANSDNPKDPALDGSQQDAVTSEDAADETLAPYFITIDPAAKLEQLPLKSVKVEVEITSIVAQVQIEQTYRNTGKTPIEALYVFPAGTRAAIHSMEFILGDRRISADLQKRAEARTNYETARDAGKSASLLEQHRPNVFQMNVANIQPGDVVTVRLNYSELMRPTDGVYRFIYPTVVGPRYSIDPASSVPKHARWVSSP